MSKSIKKLYVVELYGGYMGMLSCRTMESAVKTTLKEHGTRNLKEVREATEEDLAHFTSMGGRVPE